MADEKKEKQRNKFGILVHGLPSKDRSEVSCYYSKKYIEKMSHDSTGVQIFFKNYDQVKKSIYREKITVGGLSYKIYPMVTNLTICGIAPFVNDSVLEDIMRPYGFIIDLYRIQEAAGKTLSLTDDYRIILDVPEVFANLNLTPIILPDMTDRVFEILFFCRLCRRNGHKQYQCPSRRKYSSSTCPQSKDINRRMSHEYITSDINQNKKNKQSDLNEQNGFHYLSKIKEEKNYFPDEEFSDKTETYKNHTPKGCIKKETFFNPEDSNRDTSKTSNINLSKKEHQDNFRRNLKKKVSASKKPGANNASTSKEIAFRLPEKKRSLKKSSCHQHYREGETTKKIETSNENECCSQAHEKERREKNFTNFLRRLLPQNEDLFRARKLIKKSILYSDPKQVSAETVAVLQNILSYNSGIRKKELGKTAKIFLQWIKKFLEKVRAEQIPGEEIGKDADIKFSKDKRSTAETSKRQTKRRLVLSSGIKEAISKIAGELEPTFLCNFLNQVRGRRKLIEIASIFTPNIPALASQLLEVQKAYYKYVQKRGPEEDRDISYIKRLRQKLLKLYENSTKVSVKEDVDMTEVSVKTELDMAEESVEKEIDTAEVSVKNEIDMEEVCVKTESDMNEAVKEETDILMRQTSNNGDLTTKNLSSNREYTEYHSEDDTYSFSLSSVKTEIIDLD